MSRRLAREIALQALFQLDFTPDMSEKQVIASAAAEHTEKSGAALKYANGLVHGILEQKKTIDGLIESLAKGWSIERMGNTDKNILRLAIYEIKFADEKIEPAIVINEAVVIAKLYCDADAPKFINGILAKVVNGQAK
ncbi:MAG: transcription antitermination factor NusB [Acidaminococcaceae bacterium]|nr:transcription antitermination factor NusB [Acidaminococcaceae bacterium]